MVVSQDGIELETGHPKVQGRREDVSCFTGITQGHINTDPEVFRGDPAVNKLNQPGGGEDCAGGVGLVRPREHQQHVPVVHDGERYLPPEGAADLGQAQCE